MSEEIVIEQEKEEIEKETQQATIAAGGYGYIYDAIDSPNATDSWIDLYSRDPWVKAGASSIAKVLAGLSLQLIKVTQSKTETEPDKEEEIANHDILDLIKRPNEQESGYDLFEALSIYLDTVGTGYWEIVYDKGVDGKGLGKKPAELYNIRPSRLTPVPDKEGKKISSYIFQVKKYAKKIPFTIEEIVPFKYFNPLDDWKGLGTIQAAFDEIQLEAEMVRWNKEFFKKGTIEGILRTEKTLTPKDIKDIQRMWEEMRKRQGKATPVVGKGLEYQHLGSKPIDVEFLKGREDNRRTILSVLGVPPVKVGIMDQAQYDNYKLQEEDFNRNTIIPRCMKIASAISNFLVPRYPDLAPKNNVYYYVRFNTDNLLKEDLNKLTDRIQKQIDRGLTTINEGRALLGKKPVDGGDQLFMNKNLVPLNLLEKIVEQEIQHKSKNPMDNVDNDGSRPKDSVNENQIENEKTTEALGQV